MKLHASICVGFFFSRSLQNGVGESSAGNTTTSQISNGDMVPVPSSNHVVEMLSEGSTGSADQHNDFSTFIQVK